MTLGRGAAAAVAVAANSSAEQSRNAACGFEWVTGGTINRISRRRLSQKNLKRLTRVVHSGARLAGKDACPASASRPTSRSRHAAPQCGQVSLPVISCASRPALHAQPADSGEPVTYKEKNPMLLYFKHLHPSAPAKQPEKSGPSCYNANRNQGKHLGGTKINAIPPRESWEQLRRTTKVGKPEVAHVSRRAVSPFVATCLCSMSLQQHRQRRRRRRSGGVNTRESNEIAPGMWGVVTWFRPAPSTQTIENKRTILRHRAPTPRKTEISPYM